MTGRITMRERIGLCLARWQLRRKSRTLTAAQLLAANWTQQTNSMLQLLRGESQKLLDLSEKFKTVCDAVTQQVSAAQDAVDAIREHAKQHQTVVESLRSENTILGVEIETLTAANQLALERYRADIAVQTMRQIAVSANEEKT